MTHSGRVPGGPPGDLAFVDLHCHSSASFDSLASPAALMRAARSRGLTHLAITDHDRIDAALRARDTAPDGLIVIVGEEVKSAEGDLICLFLERPIPPGLPATETIAAVRAQGGLVGIPHPFDRFRNSLLREASLATLAREVDWIEGHNARLVGRGNEQAALLAREVGLPAIAVSDAHSVLEVGVAYTALRGDPSTPAGLLAALAAVGPDDLVMGRATYFVRALTPIAKAIQRRRGNGRIRALPDVSPDSRADR